jgi:gag-polyprotein putative aspartyl protease
MLCATALFLAAISLPIDTDPRYGAILVNARINGQEATLLVDTGAASTFVSAKLAGIEHELRRSRFRADAGLEVSGVWHRAKLSLGGWSESLEVKVIDFAPVSQRFGRRIDGILGQDVLRRFGRVTIDYRAKTLELSEGPE